MKIRVYRKSEIIFRQGDAADSMFDILWGNVGIYIGYGTEQEKRLAKLATGDTFGEIGMLDHVPRSATAVALEDQTQIEEFREEELIDLFRRNPVKVMAVLRLLSQRLRNLTRKYMDVCKTAVDIAAVEDKPEDVTEETKKEVRANAERCGHMKYEGCIE